MWGERSYVKAAASLAETVTATHPPVVLAGGVTFRYTLRQAGWKSLEGRGALRSAHCCGPFRRRQRRSQNLWTPVQQWKALIHYLIAARQNSTGYYAETVGQMPLMWSEGPLEQVHQGRVHRAVPVTRLLMLGFGVMFLITLRRK